MESRELHPQKPEDHRKDTVEVSVITTSGAYPKKGKKKVKLAELVSEFLAEAQKALRLTDTTNWIVTVDGREIDPGKTFGQNGLHDTAVLQWGPREGGGG